MIGIGVSMKTLKYRQSVGLSSTRTTSRLARTTGSRSPRGVRGSYTQINHMSSHRPRFLLHVGPHKTGSTALQDALYYQAKALRRDGYELPDAHALPGPFGRPKVGNNLAFFLQGRKQASNTLWNNFTRFLDACRRNKLSVVCSAEELDQGPLGWPQRGGVNPVNLSLLSSAVRGFDVTVVLAHRTFFDWALSVHAEAFLPQPGARLNEFVKPYIPLTAWLTTARMQKLAASGGFYSTAVAARYATYFSDVRARAADDSLLVAMVCEDMGAPTACEALRGQEKRSGRSRNVASRRGWPYNAKSSAIQEMELSFLRARYQQFRMSGVPGNGSRGGSRASTAASTLAWAASSSSYTAERSCVDDERLSLLLNLSLKLDERILPFRRDVQPRAAHSHPSAHDKTTTSAISSWLIRRGYTAVTSAGLGGALPSWLSDWLQMSTPEYFRHRVVHGAFCSNIRRLIK